MDSRRQTQFIRFLQDRLARLMRLFSLLYAIFEQTPSLLPMILWQYGLVNLAQLNQIFEWLEK